ncbi:MAG: hypothetical protein ACOC1I_03345 [Spirochaetota bacterium]
MNTLKLSFGRLWLLMRHDLVTQRKSLTSTALAIAGISFGLFLIASATGGGELLHVQLYRNILLVGGFIASSVAFSELLDGKTATHYMMLPGSTLEKYLAKLLLTSLGWVAASIVVYMAATTLGTLVAGLFFAENPGVFLPVGRDVWNAVAVYLVTQQIFLFGSIYFRKVAFFKTVAGIVGVAIALGIVYLIVARVLFAPLFIGLFETGDVEAYLEQSGFDQTAAQSFINTLGRVGDVFYWVVSPIFFWIMGVLRLRETEA